MPAALDVLKLFPAYFSRPPYSSMHPKASHPFHTPSEALHDERSRLCIILTLKTRQPAFLETPQTVMR